jgi:hypothetical protein
MNIYEEAKKSISRQLIERYFYAEKAYWRNDEYWTLNPLRQDSNIGSFSIRDDGMYKDFAEHGCEGDFITLVSKRFGVTKKEAAERIINDAGGIIPVHDNNEKKKKKTVKAIKIDKATELRLRDSFVKKATTPYNLADKDNNSYVLVKFYDYREYKTGLLMFYVARYECEELKNQGLKYKKFHPFCIDKDEKIIQKMPTNFKPYPLYGINKIIGNELPIIIVQGEKCAEVEIEDYILVTYSGGDNNIQNFDFSPLKKREIYIWPDNDQQKDSDGNIKPPEHQPGYRAALSIKGNFLPQAVIFDPGILNKPEKWDIADAEEEGLDLNEIIETLKNGVKEWPPVDPYYAYKKFVDEIYGGENLIQIDGIMWQYQKDRHFWRQIKKENLSVDFQIWMEKSGAIEILDSIEKSKHSYKSQACSFISNHGLSYYNDNYFKYSAISPFIHFENGAIELTETGYAFHSREKNEENFYRELYPVNCFEYEYNENMQGKIKFENMKEHAPLFCYFIESIIPYDVKRNKEEVKKTFTFVLQIIAYSMSPIKPGEYFFGLYGDQGSAKSSFFRLISLFIGKDFIVNRSFEDFKSNRFATNDLWGAKIYVDEDIPDNQPLPDDFIKRNSGNVEISIEAKHQSTTKGVSISITMFFISNYEFRATGVEGIDRRAIILHFKNTLPEHNRDRLIMDRISGKKQHDKKTPERSGETFDERPYILNLVLDSWNEFIDNDNYFTLPEWVKSSSSKMKTTMSSIGSFFNAIIENEINTINLNDSNKTMQEYYEAYKDWCSDEGRRHKGRNKFYEDFARIKSDKYFVKKHRNRMIGNFFEIKSKNEDEDEALGTLIF